MQLYFPKVLLGLLAGLLSPFHLSVVVIRALGCLDYHLLDLILVYIGHPSFFRDIVQGWLLEFVGRARFRTLSNFAAIGIHLIWLHSLLSLLSNLCLI